MKAAVLLVLAACGAMARPRPPDPRDPRGSREAMVKAGFRALMTNDLDALVALTSWEVERNFRCAPGRHPGIEDADELDQRRERMMRSVAWARDATFDVLAVPAPERSIEAHAGERFAGCTLRHDLTIEVIQVRLRIHRPDAPTIDASAIVGMVSLGNRWYLYSLPNDDEVST